MSTRLRWGGKLRTARRYDSEGVPFLVWRVCDQALADIGPRDRHKNWKFANGHWFQNAILFDLRRKIAKLSRKNRFRKVASPISACGVPCERLAVLNSSIHPSSAVCFLSITSLVFLSYTSFAVFFLIWAKLPQTALMTWTWLESSSKWCSLFTSGNSYTRLGPCNDVITSDVVGDRRSWYN